MPVRLWQVQTALIPKSGIPEDASMNVWAFRTEGTLTESQDQNNIISALDTFYVACVSIFGAQISGTVHHKMFMRASDFDAPDAATYAAGPWGPPVLDTSYVQIGSGITTTNPLPAEVALTASFKSVTHDDVSEFSGFTRPRARRRGRIYLGPLNSGVLTQDATTKEVTISSAARTTVKDALDALDSTANIKWSTHSRVERMFVTVGSGWIDNEPDVVRRRSRESSARTTW